MDIIETLVDMCKHLFSMRIAEEYIYLLTGDYCWQIIKLDGEENYIVLRLDSIVLF